MTTEFRRVDTKRADGCYVSFARNVVDDDRQDRPDENDDGFWPSLDKTAAGWIGENPETSFDEQMARATERMAAWRAGDWGYVGIKAKAHILIVVNGVGTMCELESAGLWGVDSDSGEDYFAEVYAEEIEDLKAMIAALAAPTYVES
jgi:hypothetical protein